MKQRSMFLTWCALACRGSVIRRGLKFSVVVGAILIAINHGDAIVAGQLTAVSYGKMALTVVVPFIVSVLSSVGAMVHAPQRLEAQTEASGARR